jgi:site-specific recombinase XerC
MCFTGIGRPEQIRDVARSHVIAWRKTLIRRELAGPTIRAKLAALSSLFEYQCERNTVTRNPVKGVSRPKVEGYEGKPPAISDAQVRAILNALKGEGLKANRDRGFCRFFFITPSGQSSAPLRCGICTNDEELNTFGFMAKAASCATRRCMPARWK